jgi:type II secretory pathway component GspD/PulD (secretin)/tetratricopeptide (TPR) repeat protein
MRTRQTAVLILALLMFVAVFSSSAQEKGRYSITALKEFVGEGEKPAEAAPGPEEPEAVPARPSEPAAVTPEELATALSRAETFYGRGEYAAARDEALQVYDSRGKLSPADRMRVDLLLDRVDKALKARERELEKSIEEEMVRAGAPEAGLAEADRTLEQYRKLNMIKIQKDKAAAQDYLKAGESLLYGEKDYDKAIEMFEKAVALDPTLKKASENIEIARFMRGDKDAASKLRDEGWIPEQRVRLDANLQKLRNAIARGDQLHGEGQYPEALAEYRKAQTYLSLLETMTDVQPESERLENAIARTEKAQEKHLAELKRKELRETREKIKENLEDSQREALRSKADQFDQVLALIEDKEYEKANSIVEEMIYRDPSDRAARLLRTQISRERHRFRIAEHQGKHDRELFKVLEDTKERTIPYRELLTFPSRRIWREIIDVREPVGYPTTKREYSQEEQKVLASLDRPVDVDFTDTPLPDVLAFFREVNQVNIALDRASLPDDMAPVTLKMSDVPLKTALKEILEPINMSYVVEGNVIRVARKDKLAQYEMRVYDVRDLLLNFEDKQSSGRNLSLASTTRGLSGGTGGGGFTTGGGTGAGGNNGGEDFGGATESIRDRVQSLALLISQVVRPETWRQVSVIGGAVENNGNDGGTTDEGFGGEEFGFGQEDVGLGEEAGLAAGQGRIIVRGGNPGDLVILQTPEIHTEVEDLLRALRRSQTIQVQIDARFLTVSDNWLKSVGVNLNSFNWRSNSYEESDDVDLRQATIGSVMSPSVGAPIPIIEDDGTIGVGLGDSIAVPFFGTGTAPSTDEPWGLNLNFSVFDGVQLTGFFKALQKADSNETLSSPRVTLTNAQRGFIQVGTQTNFVASFGAQGDVAAPDIQTIDDSIGLDVRPIVSADRKYVYLELAPYIRTVVDIQVFEFSGERTSNGANNGETISAQRVQLPVQAVQEIGTTVMVPDRGVLTIGGLTTYSEAQIQRGTPLLSKIPIIKRIFNSDRKTRDRRNLMILVRPQIILLEEEKAAQL